MKVVHKQNGGLSDARNAGMKLVEGEYVAFIDSDDYVDLHMFEKLYAAAKERNLDVCYCDYNLIMMVRLNQLTSKKRICL